MLRFWKSRAATAEHERPRANSPLTLGSLEGSVMNVLWARGEVSVRDVAAALDRPLAYTTVMTTLDRLFKKGLLERRKFARAFLYAPRLTREHWERQRAEDLVAGFLRGPGPSRELLLSCLLGAVGQQDQLLLEDLEKRIRQERKKLMRKAEPGWRRTAR
jgi:predicted transcriptional regulator